MINVDQVEFRLSKIRAHLKLTIKPKRKGTLFDCNESANENNEAEYQLIEGLLYDYEINNEDFILDDIGHNIIQPHALKNNIGTIAPGIFVGTLLIPIKQVSTNKIQDYIELEVQSTKAKYRKDYRTMLEFISSKCIELIFQHNSPALQNFTINSETTSKSAYQRFSFIKSIIKSDEFTDALNKILYSPSSGWSEINEEQEIGKVKKFTRQNVKELTRGSKRSQLTNDNYLRKYKITSVPDRLLTSRKIDDLDTPENRFIKHTLKSFLIFFYELRDHSNPDKRLYRESNSVIGLIEKYLSHSLFKKVSNPTTLNLNNPTLQRKSGYREIFKYWFMFELASKLNWSGGDYVYSAGKKNVANLYEYWVFFQLLDIFSDLFEMESSDISKLIQNSDDGLSVQLTQGKSACFNGTFVHNKRKLNICFHYNRSFKNIQDNPSYPKPGSWTTTLRPDYTLSIWDYDLNEEEAEISENIIHLHFDAKYKISNYLDLIHVNSDNQLEDEKNQNRSGQFKNGDLLKMHAYKDAIRRSEGAFIIYPGDKDSTKRVEYHEILPSLGAFPLKPQNNDKAIVHFKSFIKEIMQNIVDESSNINAIRSHKKLIYKK